MDPAFKDVEEEEDGKVPSPEPEVVQMVMDDVDLEDFQIRSIVTHSIEKGYLHLLVELDSGKFLPIPFSQLKKDHPLILAQYIMTYDVNRTHKKWAQNKIRQRRRSLRRLYFLYGVDKAFHIKIRRVSKGKLKKLCNS